MLILGVMVGYILVFFGSSLFKLAKLFINIFLFSTWIWARGFDSEKSPLLVFIGWGGIILGSSSFLLKIEEDCAVYWNKPGTNPVVLL